MIDFQSANSSGGGQVTLSRNCVGVVELKLIEALSFRGGR